VHHIRFRSVGGKDETSNLAALCRCCHAEIHAYRLTLSGDANGKLRIERSA
jgi:5-methylcytosine-specific restriction endonuclease McrA